MRRLGVVALAFGVLAAAAAAGPEIGGGGRIAFVSNRAVDLQRTRFAAVTPTGSRTLELGVAPRGASIAPDRQRYAFVEYEAPSTWRLRVAAFRNSGSTVVATHAYPIENPVWSRIADGIAYTASNPASCNPGDHLCATSELWLVSAVGGGARKLADHAAEPVWSPSGNLLAFAGEYNTYAANDGWKGKPYVAYVHSTVVRRIVDVNGVDRISWSPKSDRVVVSAHRGFAVVASLRGAKPRKILSARTAVWSPRGDAIAFARGSSIVLVRPDGRRIRSFNAAGHVEALSWSPDATRLACVIAAPTTEQVPRTSPRRTLITIAATGRTIHTVARFDRFQLAKLLGWLREGYVLYQTWREVNDFDLFTMNPDGGDVRQLTDDDLHQDAPAWAPDGRRIVFSQWDERTLQGELRVIAVPGFQSTRVVDPPFSGLDSEPAWSPDEKLIAFTRYTDPSSRAGNLFVVRPDGTGLTLVTPNGSAPAWWPDSRHLVFSRWEGSRPLVYTIAVDGTGERKLFDGLTGVPSRDGSRIAYVTAGGLWVANADGLDARLVDPHEPLGRPSWSPDQAYLVFQASAPASAIVPSSHWRVLTVAATGGDEAAPAEVGADDRSPAWSPSP